MRAAFFDMDNTLLRVETGMSWVRFLYKRGELPPRMVAKAIYWQALRLWAKGTPFHPHSATIEEKQP